MKTPLAMFGLKNIIVKLEKIEKPKEKSYEKEHLESKLFKSHRIQSKKIIDELYDPKKKVDLKNTEGVYKIEDIE